MKRSAGASSLKLATARLEFASDRRMRTALQVTLAATLVGIAAVAGYRLYADGRAPATRLYELQHDNDALRAELARVQTELELAQSERTALAGQVAELNKRAGELKSELDFVKAQSGRSGKSR